MMDFLFLWAFCLLLMVGTLPQEIVTSPQADADIRSPDRLSAETVLQDSSLAEGAAGLLAMTSTADRAKDGQVNPLLSSKTSLVPSHSNQRCCAVPGGAVPVT